MKKIIVAIDGLAATGKSTLAKRLAKELNYTYINTGAMYRAITYYALENNLDQRDLISALPDLSIRFEEENNSQKALLNDEDITNELHSMKVANQVSIIASIPKVREFLVDQQRKMGIQKGIVMDGRDIGTVVFPEAECKFFLTANVEIRAQRRIDELHQLGSSASYDKVVENLVSRDNTDSNRDISPLTKALDAITVDVSELTLEEVYSILKGRVMTILER
ncbi:MAG: (d)CMP kinase [Flavobacteriaceae bacterium]|nr:(d)CMP kinase [Flavobacteriaceae bacterium]